MLYTSFLSLFIHSNRYNYVELSFLLLCIQVDSIIFKLCVFAFIQYFHLLYICRKKIMKTRKKCFFFLFVYIVCLHFHIIEHYKHLCIACSHKNLLNYSVLFSNLRCYNKKSILNKFNFVFNYNLSNEKYKKSFLFILYKTRFRSRLQKIKNVNI